MLFSWGGDDFLGIFVNTYEEINEMSSNLFLICNCFLILSWE